MGSPLEGACRKTSKKTARFGRSPLLLKQMSLRRQRLLLLIRRRLFRERRDVLTGGSRSHRPSLLHRDLHRISESDLLEGLQSVAVWPLGTPIFL